jgi:DNA invertase Pin-like site-specific DNA recombinase
VLVAALRDFEALGVDFISATQDIDTTTSMGRLFFHIVGSFAEFERELIVERVRAGLENARAKGTRLGRPRDLKVEMRIRKLHEAGTGVRAIARAVKRSPAGVLRILKRI